MVTSPKSKWLHPMPRMLSVPVYFAFGSQRAPAFKVASRNRADLELAHRPGGPRAGDARHGPALGARRCRRGLRVQGEFHAKGKSVVIP